MCNVHNKQFFEQRLCVCILVVKRNAASNYLNKYLFFTVLHSVHRFIESKHFHFVSTYTTQNTRHATQTAISVRPSHIKIKLKYH